MCCVGYVCVWECASVAGGEAESAVKALRVGGARAGVRVSVGCVCACVGGLRGSMGVGAHVGVCCVGGCSEILKN